MATVNQVYELLNTVQEMAYGKIAVNVIDTSSFVALAQTVLSSDGNKDLYTNTLIDRIGLVLSDNRLYNADDNNLIKRQYEYAVIMQKIHVEPIEAEENPEWLIGAEDFTPEYAPVLKPVVKQKLFHNMVTWELGVTVPDNMLKTAFTNEVQFGAFMVAIMNALTNGVELMKERAVDITRATMISHVLNSGGISSINLLDEYNNTLPASSTPLTPTEYLQSEKALAHGAMLMSLTADRLQRFNSLFNGDGYNRFTPREFLKCDVLNVLDYAIKYNVKPVVFNERFIETPNYKTVPYWQGAGTDYGFNSISKVHVSETHTDTDTGEDVTTTVAEQTGVVGVMYDEEACGINIFADESAYERNDRAHYTTHYRQMTGQYYYDDSEQAVVFYLATA